MLTVNPSEREFSPETVCVWLSGLYIARYFNPGIPATKAETLALAAASGVPNGGSGNFTKLAKGMKDRYGLTGVQATPAQVLARSLNEKIVVALAGNQLNLVPHWQGNPVGHAIAVLYENGQTGVQYDPLAPAGYLGDKFSPAELTKYATAALLFKEDTTVVTVTRTLFPEGNRRFATKVGPLVGYKIGAPNKTINLANPSSAHADAEALISPLPPNWPAGPMLEVVDGGFAGYFVSKAAVTLDIVVDPVTRINAKNNLFATIIEQAAKGKDL